MTSLVQSVILGIFIIVALACASSSEVVGSEENGGSGGTTFYDDGASLESPQDSMEIMSTGILTAYYQDT